MSRRRMDGMIAAVVTTLALLLVAAPADAGKRQPAVAATSLVAENNSTCAFYRVGVFGTVELGSTHRIKIVEAGIVVLDRNVPAAQNSPEFLFVFHKEYQNETPGSRIVRVIVDGQLLDRFTVPIAC